MEAVAAGECAPTQLVKREEAVEKNWQATMAHPPEEAVEALLPDAGLHDVCIDDEVGRKASERDNNMRKEIRRYIEQGRTFVLQHITVDKIRSLFVFTGIGEEKPFALPPSQQRYQQLVSNLSFFLVNYVLLTFIIGTLYVLYQPTLILWCALIGGGWAYVVKFAPETVEVGGRTVNKKEMGFAMSAVTVLILLYCMLIPLFYVIFIR